MRLIIIILILTLILNSCKKETINLNEFWQCNKSQNLDTIAIANKLTGSWTWRKQSCSSSGKTILADKIVKVTFNSNRTFSLSENAIIVTQGNWKLKIVDSNIYGLDLTPQSEYLYGRILFCNDEVLFNDSYIDGCDNLFCKIN
jgi:hypothetical protein